MADISKITLPNGSSYDFKDSVARSGLAGKAASSHTHTKSQITDFPTIPTKTSQLTNDSGFKTTDYTLPKATTSTLGGVIPDGTTITVNTDGIISAVGGSDDWTNVGRVSVGNEWKDFSIPNLSNYKFIMLNIMLPGSMSYSTFKYTTTFFLDEYFYTSERNTITYSIPNNYDTTTSGSTVYAHIGSMGVNKSSNTISLYARTGFAAIVYVK